MYVLEKGNWSGSGLMERNLKEVVDKIWEKWLVIN